MVRRSRDTLVSVGSCKFSESNSTSPNKLNKNKVLGKQEVTINVTKTYGAGGGYGDRQQLKLNNGRNGVTLDKKNL